MTQHQAVAAYPIGSAANKTAARAMAVKRTAYCIDTATEAVNLVAVDPDTGDIPICLVLLGRVYLYDAADVTSVHDGTTVLVTSDGKRYKLAAGSDMVAYSVINVTTTAPPGSPTITDMYLVATGGTGAWAGHDGEIAIYTARGWEFAELQIGRFLYDESTDSYYHKKADSSLVLGFGTQTLQSNTHPVSALIGRPVRWIVVNQTTNTPPGSPSTGDAYIVGSSPTGAWVGHAGKIAVCEVGTTFTIYAPRDGELAYDQANKTDYRFDTTTSAWVSQAGAIIGSDIELTVSGSTSTGGSGNYAIDPSVAPTSSQAYTQDDVTLTYTARKTGARLRFQYTYNAAAANSNTVALFRDSEANAVDWWNYNPHSAPAGNRSVPTCTFEITASDASAHTYKIRLINNGAGAAGAITRRKFSVEEFS